MGALALVLSADVLAASAKTPSPIGPLRNPSANPMGLGLPENGLLLDSYAAIVKDKVVTVGDVLAAAAPLQARAASSMQGPARDAELAKIYALVRDDLVGVKLVLLEFEDMGAQLPEHAIEDRISSVLQERFHGSRSELLSALSESRLTLDEWREQMRQQLIVQVMREREVNAKVSISPLDIQAAYDADPAAYAIPEQVRLEVVSIRAPRPSNSVEVEQAREFYRRLLRVSYGRLDAPVDAEALRRDFPRLDVQHEPAHGWIEFSSLAPDFQKGLEGVVPGRMASPIELAGRTYFLRLVDRHAASTVTLEEAAPAIERRLRAAEEDRLMKAWVDNLRTKYHVQLFDHHLYQIPDNYDPEGEE